MQAEHSIMDFIVALLHDGRFWFLVAFILFIRLLGRRAWCALSQFLEAHAQTIKNEIDTAQDKKKHAQEMLAEAKEQYVKAQTTAAAILEQAEHEIEAMRLDVRRDLEHFQYAREKAMLERVRNAQEKAQKEIQSRSVSVAMRTAEIILKNRITPEIDAHFIDQAIEDIDKIQKLVA